jgi:hypothetical protein
MVAAESPGSTGLRFRIPASDGGEAGCLSTGKSTNETGEFFD